MLIIFYVLLVWIKIIVGTMLVFLLLWWARDRALGPAASTAVLIGALTMWAGPWAWFFWSQADLYQGHCGLRQGVHDCGLSEFLWGRMRWLRVGAIIDVALLIGVLALLTRAKISREELTRAFRR